MLIYVGGPEVSGSRQLQPTAFGTVKTADYSKCDLCVQGMIRIQVPSTLHPTSCVIEKISH